MLISVLNPKVEYPHEEEQEREEKHVGEHADKALNTKEEC